MHRQELSDTGFSRGGQRRQLSWTEILKQKKSTRGFVAAQIKANHAGKTCQHIDFDSAALRNRLAELSLSDEAQLHRKLQTLNPA